MTWTVTLDPATDITGWTIEVVIRAYNGGSALVTKTTASGISITDAGNGVFVTTFSAANLQLTHGPGAYVIQASRTDSGFAYPITDPSPLILRSSNSSAYPTLTNLGEYAAAVGGLPTLTDAESTQYVMWLAAAESLLRRVCARQFTYGSRVFYLDGTGTEDLLIPETPVQSITSIYEDYGGRYGQATDAFASTTLLTSGDDYYLVRDDAENANWSKSGIVKRVGATWPARHRRPPHYLGSVREGVPGALKVTAVTGYNLVPFDLKLAIFDIVNLYKAAALDGRLLQSESGEGYSYSLGGLEGEALRLGSVQSVIALYRHGRTFVR